jgi:hypothetical protein
MNVLSKPNLAHMRASTTAANSDSSISGRVQSAW